MALNYVCQGWQDSGPCRSCIFARARDCTWPVPCIYLHIYRRHRRCCIYSAFTLHLLTAFALTPRLQASSIHLHTSECRILWPRTECKLLRLGSCQLNSLRTMYVYRHRFTLKTAINLVKRNAGQ